MSFDLSRPSLPYSSPLRSPLSHPFMEPTPPVQPLSPSTARLRRHEPPSPTLHDLFYHPTAPLVVPLSLAPSRISSLPTHPSSISFNPSPNPAHPLPHPVPSPFPTLPTPFPRPSQSPPRPPQDVDPELYDILQMASAFEGTEEGGGLPRPPFFQHSMPQSAGEDVLGSLSPDRLSGRGGGGSPFGSPVRSPGGASHPGLYERAPSVSPTAEAFSAPRHSHREYEGGAVPLLSTFPVRGQSLASGLQEEREVGVKVEALGSPRFMPHPASDPALHRRTVSSSSSSSHALPSLPPSNAPSSSSTPSLSTLPPSLPQHVYPQSTADLHRLMQATSPLYSSFHLPSPSFHGGDEAEDDDNEGDDYVHDDSPPFHSLPSPSSSRRKRAASSKSSPYYQSPGSTAYSRSLTAKRESEEREEEKERMELRAIDAEEEMEKEDHMEEGGGGGRAEGEEGGEGEDHEGHEEGDATPIVKHERPGSRLARKVHHSLHCSPFHPPSVAGVAHLPLLCGRLSWLVRLASVASCTCSRWRRRRSGWRPRWTSCSGS